ncbi:MAG TPA: plasma-membrane proton-efflux P-type ATPase [Candidatus Acidoferrales bacterium]|nr:plasma-membrane proton-efflux P-type ATPase [Candidatus Acidoferrales bacterium]
MYSGLSTSQASILLQKNGYNEIPEKHVSLLHKIFKNLISPIALMLLLASGLSFVLGKTFDGYFILVLLVLNILITLWQENKADSAIKKLNETLEQKTKVFRDNKWQDIASRMLVIGDVIKLASGEVIPADGKIVEANHVSANESALTGESLPKDKKVNDTVSSGSFIASGIAVIEVTATGAKTNFGKTLFSVELVKKKSLLEKDIISISRFLTVLSLIAVVILTVVFLLKKASFLELLTLDLSLLIAGIPISLPTVMTLIIEFGVLALATKNVIVRRLSALEDLANVNFLLTDKTGTLTENKITIQDIHAYDGFTNNDVLRYASMLATSESDNPIDAAIIQKTKEFNLTIAAFTKADFIPADAERKRSTIVINKDNKDMVISVGAPQIIARLCIQDKPTLEKFNKEVDTLAHNGDRTLAIALAVNSKEEKQMKMVGLLALSDTLRPDAKSVVQFLKENGIGVAMVTGDNRAIAENIAKQLALTDGKIVTKEVLDKTNWDTVNVTFFQSTGAFAEILPEDKFRLVQQAKKFFIVASNGDGINDLPALKAANVGIAVKNAVTALKATADIVLLSDGISVIRDAIIESRKIFERIYTYSLYRISESLRLIITIAVLGILYGVYPMTALQIILIALLNDIPIISLAYDNVKITNSPSKIDVKKRFTLSSLFGMVGVVNSLLLFFIVRNIWHLDWTVIQTMYFLKLTVSGHMLIYVAHTKQRWWKFLPSKQVIWATSITQLIATGLAFTGFLMSGRLTLGEIGFVWIWTFLWMQISEVMKVIQQKQGNIS